MYRTRFSSALAMAASAAILFPSLLHAQITFERTYGGQYTDYGNSVQQTADSGYVIAGYTGRYATDSNHVLLIKTDAHGDTLWTRTYGDTNYAIGSSAQQTADGGYVIAGHIGPPGAGSNDVCLIKTDENGDTAWTRTFGGTRDDRGHSVQQTADSGYIIAGYTESFGEGVVTSISSSAPPTATRYGQRPTAALAMRTACQST